MLSYISEAVEREEERWEIDGIANEGETKTGYFD